MTIRLSPDSHNSGFTFSDFTFPVSHFPDSHFLTQGRDLDLKKIIQGRYLEKKKCESGNVKPEK